MLLMRVARVVALVLACVALLSRSLQVHYSQAASLQVVDNQTSIWCANVAAKAMLMSCDLPDREDAFIRIVGRKYTACVENNGTNLPQPVPMVRIMVPTHLYVTYQKLADKFVDLTGKRLAVVPVDLDQMRVEALFEFSSNMSDKHHGWIMYMDSYYPLEQQGALLDLTNLTAASPDAQAIWVDLPARFRQLSQSYVGLSPGPNKQPKTLSLPLDASAPLMYYLPDVLANYNLSVPRTWSEVLYVAQKINGTDVDADGDPEYAICFRPDPDCLYASALGMVLAPYLQYTGTNQGAFLRPDGMIPLFDNAGGHTALGMFAKLMKYHTILALQGEDCLSNLAARAFITGDCALAFGWGDTFKNSERSDEEAAKGKYATSMLPGSEMVYDRDTMALKACTEEVCSYGLHNRAERIVHQETHEIVYVNRAPYLPYTGVVGIVSAQVDSTQQQVAYDFLIYLAQNNLQMALSTESLLGPYRTSLLNSSNTSLLAEFAAAGFDPITTASYMSNIVATLEHGNVVPGPNIPRVDSLRFLLAVAAANLASNTSTPKYISQQLQVEVLEQVVQNTEYQSSLLQLQDAYWNFIGYKPKTPPDGDSHQSMDMPAVSLAVPVASALVVLVASILYEFKKHRQHRSLFGKVVAPGPFEDTTLLVTDIQDSTALWEILPSSIMDRAIKEHHSCLRKLLLKHSGYESATEGDSFLLAFHCPEDALLFAMESQVALLECAWPMELLDCEVCRPYYVVHNESDKRATLLADNVDAVGSLMALPRAHSGLSNKSTSEDTSSPQASTALVTHSSEVNTFSIACQASWKEATATTPNNVLIFRGLRVRMGMHTGISNEADVVYNKAAARMQYSGEILQYGKAVSDAAAGGMILLSEATYRRLPMERLWDKAMVMHVGEYKLKDDLPVLPLYQVTGRRLMGRLGYLSDMRFKEQLSKGVFTAPLGAVTMAYLGIVGSSTLLAWHEALTREALGQLHGCVSELVHKWGGFLVEATDQQVHVVFTGAAEALLWALAVHQALMELPWPEALLEHELAEELIVGDVVVFRGLRVKTGVDAGHAVGEVNALSGRICYRGKVVTRTVRIMESASSNQVLASGEAWAAAQAASPGLLQLRGIVGDRLGPFKLRGVADRVEMVQVRLQLVDVAGADGWAQDLHEGGGGARMATDEVVEGDIVPGADAPPTSPEDGSLSARGFSLLSRVSRGPSSQLLLTAGAMRTATLSGPPTAGVDSSHSRFAATVSTSFASPLHLQSSSTLRRLRSLRIFGSTRAQSFTAGLLHRMGAGSRSRGRGSGRASILVDASAVSVSAATAVTNAATLPVSVMRNANVDLSVSVHSAATASASTTITSTAAMQPISVPARAAVATTHSGLPAANSAASSVINSLSFLRGSRGDHSGSSRGGSLLPGSNPFPFPSARRLLPSSWTLGGGGGMSSGSIPATGGGGGAQGLSTSALRTLGDLSGLASMVATSLPASRSLGTVVSSLPVATEAPDVAITVNAGGAGCGGGGGGATMGGEIKQTGDVSSAGWMPGEMLADVLHGVQEEDERLSGRMSTALTSSLRVSSKVA